MESLYLLKPGGNRVYLDAQNPPVSIRQGQQRRALGGEDVLTLTIDSTTILDIGIGDRLDAFGESYTVNQLPQVAKMGERSFTYELTAEGPQYALLRVLVFDLDANGVSTGYEFSLTGDLTLFAQVLLRNVGRTLGGWQLGDVRPGGPVKTLSFSATNALAYLQQLCTEFEVEFDVERLVSVEGFVTRRLNLRRQGQTLPDQFAYGAGRGLYKLTRDNADAPFVTRLWATGATKNIPASYRSGALRLQLPANGYVENAAAKTAFGLIEGAKTFDEVYPHRTGTITAVDVSGKVLTDAGMDFDLMAFTTQTVGSSSQKVYTYLLPGVTAKLQVQTGALAGYGFEVSAYNHATKQFTIASFKDERGMVFPSETSAAFRFAVGDTYVLLDINMPASYVTAAEQELLGKASAYLAANSAPNVQYSLTVDEAYLMARTSAGSTVAYFRPGDELRVVDEQLAVNHLLRVLGVRRDVLKPYQYELEVGDSYEVTVIDRILAAQTDLQNVVRLNDLRDSTMVRFGWRAGQELLGLFFDTDGQFDGSRIRPGTIETAMLSVGAKSGQLVLNVLIEPNYNSQPNAVRTSAGTLSHYTIEDTIRNWTFGGQTLTLADNAARYVYARCHRANSTDASLQFSTLQKRVDEDSLYYWFLIGVLSSVDSSVNARLLSLTYGATTVNGRFIRTGRIQSADGGTYFDLDSGEIGGNIIFSGNTGGGGTSNEELQSQLNFLNNITLPTLRRSLSGRIVSYYQDSDPNTWSAGDRKNHDGDVWRKTSTGQVFQYRASDNSWQPNTDPNVIAAYELASRAKDTADGKRRAFSVTPFAPYDAGDLWADGANLWRATTGKAAGQAFNAADWSPATSYDNTKTAINGGIVTSGRIQLAGDEQTVVAGITGQGTAANSIRFWSGSSYEGRASAPFRVQVDGGMFARRQIEVQNADGVGQAGMAGTVDPGDGPVRIWAGADYPNRNLAPFRVDETGSATMTRGRVGKLTLVAGGLEAVDGDSSLQININRPDPNAANDLVNMRSEIDSDNPNHLRLIALHLKATRKPEAVYAMPYALYAAEGMAMLNEGLLNGRATRHFASTTTRTVTVNQMLTDFVTLYPSGGRMDVQLTSLGEGYVRNGKEITLMNLNDSYSECFLKNVVRGETETRIMGGEVIVIMYVFGYWFTKSRFDNNFSGSLNIPLTDQ